ncbi:MAG: type II secretion system F family protein [Lachnospiraceae bacterium]|nr:type II secretion system F family protein [Lachnospiraceae bacterium]
MAEFTYIAMDGEGKQKRGNIVAETETLALEMLSSEDLYPIKLKKANILTREMEISIGKAVSSRDLSVFCRQFASMLSAGVTLMEALDMLAAQTENKSLVKALKNVRKSIMKGETLSSAMRKENKVFPELMINMVVAGENAGKLQITFQRMAIHFEKTAKTEGMIKKASIYPIIVTIVAIIVTVVMLMVAIPKFMNTFESMEMDMPKITLFVVGMSDFLIAHWMVIAGIIVAVVAACKWYGSTEAGKLKKGQIAISLPLLGDLNIKTISSLTARSMGTLLYSGMTLVEAIDIMAKTVGNELFRKALLEAEEDVKQGVEFSTSLKRTNLYPHMVCHMIGIGEETGDMDEMLDKLANYYDEEVEQTTQTVMAALEPMIILVMAALVGLLVAAVMAPMIQMYSQMGSL